MINDIEGQLAHVLSENMNLHRKIDGMQERVDNLRSVKAEMEGERYDKDKRIAELEKERAWIDVVDELPRTTMNVLVTNGEKVGKLTYVKYVNGTGRWAGNSEDITAWMLKPKPPKALKERVK